MLDHANSYEGWFGSVCNTHYFGCRVHDGLYRLLEGYRYRDHYTTLPHAAYQWIGEFSKDAAQRPIMPRDVFGKWFGGGGYF